MFDLNKVKGIIFDYGGTIDSNGKHWAEVIWEAYRYNNVPVSKEEFREAYVYAERYLATHHVIEENDNFYDLLKKKTELQIKYLVSNNFLENNDKSGKYSLDISDQCYNFVRNLISAEKPILNDLCQRYPMVLVSNFYGNIHAVLGDFGLLGYFDKIIESAVVGIRKPDPAIFSMGVAELNLASDEVVVIGDSYSKDIVPARTIGCQTIWLKGTGWGDEEENATADKIIFDFIDLKGIFKLA
ncbi:MAG: HAD family hydrolase [Dysgonomonas sp.]